MLFPQLAKQVSRATGRAGSSHANARNLGPALRANLPKNVVTKGMNEPNIRVSDRVLDGRKRQLSRGTLPITKSNPSPSAEIVSSKEIGSVSARGIKFSNGETGAAFYRKENLGGGKKRTLNRGTVSGGSMRGGGGTQQPVAASGGGGTPPVPPGPKKRNLNRGQLEGGSMKGRTDQPSRWRGIEDIKNTATGQAPLTTFFRNREARDNMMKSGEGSKHEWAKGTISKGRVAGTVAAGYAGLDTMDRATGGGSITRNETGRFDMMGIPIL